MLDIVSLRSPNYFILKKQLYIKKKKKKITYSDVTIGELERAKGKGGGG